MLAHRGQIQPPWRQEKVGPRQSSSAGTEVGGAAGGEEAFLGLAEAQPEARGNFSPYSGESRSGPVGLLRSAPPNEVVQIRAEWSSQKP